MPIINETLYNKPTLDALLRVANFTIKQQKNLRNRLLCLLVALGGLGLSFFYEFSNPVFLSACRFFGFAFLLIVILWNLMQSFPNFAYGRKPELRRLQFTEEGFGPTLEGARQFPYDDIADIVVTADWIALFWDEKHGLILDRDGFVEGSSEELIELLSQDPERHIITI